jgi:hypothetical protein
MPSPGARVPSIPPGSRRMVLCVPDNVEWLSLVTGCLAQLTFGWYYNKNSGDWEAARDRAKQMYFEFQDQNGLCDVIDCDEVADCIESSENVQQAIRNWLDANYQFSPSDYPPNVPLPTDQRNADRAGVFNPSCDPDILWAQSVQLVEWMNERISQALDVIEATTNTFEFAGAVAQITGLDEISVDAAFAYGGLLQEFIGENYAAGYSDVYRDELACVIFCAAQGDCEISLDDLFNLFAGRVQAYFGTSGAFGVLDDVIDYLTGSAIDGTIVVDAAFFLLWGGVSLANWIVGGLANDVEIGTKSLNLLLKLAVNDANDDWILLCDDCPEAWAVSFPDELPFSTFTALTYSGATTTIDADSIDGHTDTGDTAVFLNFEIDLDGDISKVEFDVAWAFNTPFQQFILSDESGTIQSFNLNGTSPATFTANFTRTGAHTYTVLAGVQGTEEDARYLRVTGMRWYGPDNNPFI